MKNLTKAEESVLLTITRLDDSAYGVTIKRKLKELTGQEIPYGTLYFILDQLTVKELVIRSKGEPTSERGGKSKTYYTLSQDGFAALKESAEMHAKVWQGIDHAIFERLSK